MLSSSGKSGRGGEDENNALWCFPNKYVRRISCCIRFIIVITSGFCDILIRTFFACVVIGHDHDDADARLRGQIGDIETQMRMR